MSLNITLNNNHAGAMILGNTTVGDSAMDAQMSGLTEEERLKQRKDRFQNNSLLVDRQKVIF
jgi:hypothetical protein